MTNSTSKTNYTKLLFWFGMFITFFLFSAIKVNAAEKSQIEIAAVDVWGGKHQVVELKKGTTSKKIQIEPLVFGKPIKYQKAKYSTSNKKIATVSKSGLVTLKGTGEVYITIKYKKRIGYLSFTVNKKDLSLSTKKLANNKLQIIVKDGNEIISPEEASYKLLSVDENFEVSSDGIVTASEVRYEKAGGPKGSFRESNDDLILVTYKNKSSILHIESFGKKQNAVGKQNRVQRTLSFNYDSLELAKGQTDRNPLYGTVSGKKVRYSSSNKKVATVSKTGRVTAKKAGWALITATDGESKTAYVVNVARNKKMLSLLDQARKIRHEWVYNQGKRAQKGYYDCSSLVWRVYKQYYNIDFDSSSPGWTGSENTWCKKHAKKVKPTGMNMQLGDIQFLKDKGKIWHVQTFAGYSCTGFDANGKPKYYANWIFGLGRSKESKSSLIYRPTERK